MSLHARTANSGLGARHRAPMFNRLVITRVQLSSNGGPSSSGGGVKSVGDVPKARRQAEIAGMMPSSPLRAQTREFMLGVLTARATRTLTVYLQETNQALGHWLMRFQSENPITLSGTWEEISGDSFVRKLLSMPIEEAHWGVGVGMGGSAPPGSGICVDPRSIAQRILQIRAQLAREVAQDLRLVQDDNDEFLRVAERTALERSLAMAALPVADGAAASGGGGGPVHPEMRLGDLDGDASSA
ncbi:hypothetical protein FOA52_009804 [Chlamydomonas sp. UWO 241]|nr:hypothetical protein FOA52_009804 [Chlamydomonas sp. UWO 241]